MVLFYGVSIVFFVFSNISVHTSLFLKNSCGIFIGIVYDAKNKSLKYIELAKKHINSADNVALMILSEYNAWLNLKQTFLDNGMGQMNETYTPLEYKNTELWVPERPNKLEFDRKLSVTNEFNPIKSIAEGRSVLFTLNKSIYETEKQILYYDTQFNIVEKVCYDYAGLYDNFILILIGSGILLLSHFLVFATHYKYFSVWNYEVKLLNFNR